MTFWLGPRAAEGPKSRVTLLHHTHFREKADRNRDEMEGEGPWGQVHFQVLHVHRDNCKQEHIQKVSWGQPWQVGGQTLGWRV